ncbi:phosphatidate cytidylyltransferase [Pseudokineococcus sp. 1T1Z-3]|uniref:phosphatidate cytidylyltransferase n=1 Tax=Pseudokineococcus sp. 1T1Z-3 TaxID=3132745 RepID=UPI0030A24C30
MPDDGRTTSSTPTGPATDHGHGAASPAAQGAAAAATTSPSEAPRRRSAGRDLPAAIGVGLLIAGVSVGTLLVLREAFLVLLVVVIAAGVLEVSAALRTRQLVVPRTPVLVGGTVLLVAAFVQGAEAALVVYGLTCVAVVAWRVAEGRDGAVRDVTAGLLVLSWLPLLASTAVLTLAEPDGQLRVLVFVAAVVGSDVGGYAAGATLGRHPLAPSVSPKKSWEGLAGSVLVSLTVGAVLVVVLLGGPWWAGVVLGALVGLTATFGDLAESMLKRDLGIKDMGRWLPGHGGIMDRLDSLVVTAPMAWLVLALLVPVP